MRHKWVIILAVILGGQLLLPVGLYLSQLYQRERNTRAFLRTIQEADSATIRIHVGSEGVALPVPPEEFARIKETLQRVRSVRPAMGGGNYIIIDPIGYSFMSFVNAEGKRLNWSWNLAFFPDLMSESQAKGLALLREYDVYEPKWYLPDVELEELMSLPIMKEAHQCMEEKAHSSLQENSCDSY